MVDGAMCRRLDGLRRGTLIEAGAVVRGLGAIAAY
jgi:hypothetical protein